MPANDQNCSICHLANARLPCPKCFRNFHFNCANKICFPGQIIVDPNDPRKHKFAISCPECRFLDIAALEWVNGVNFERISKKSLNGLLLHMLEILKQEAPEPYLWPASKLANTRSPIPIDFTVIKNKATAALYNCPKEFLEDIFLINHNFAAVARNSNYSRGNAALTKLLFDYKDKMVEFKKTAEEKIRYLHDCPHCFLNFHAHGDSWLTAICPWGHPLILCRIPGEDLLWPAKLLKIKNKHSRAVVLLFGQGDRKYLTLKACWVPCRSDLDVQPKKKELKTAYEQVRRYASILKKKFGSKFSLPPRRRQLVNNDKNHICKGITPSKDNEVVALTDDEQSSEDCGTVIDQWVNDENTDEGDEEIEDKSHSFNDKDERTTCDTNPGSRNNDQNEAISGEESCCSKEKADESTKGTTSDLVSAKVNELVEKSPEETIKESIHENAKEHIEEPVEESTTEKVCDMIENDMALVDKVNEKTVDNDSSIFKTSESGTENSTECAMEEPIVSSTQTTEETDILTNDQFTQFEICRNETEVLFDGPSISEDNEKMDMNITEITHIAEDFVIEEKTNDFDELNSSPILDHFMVSLDEKDETTIFESNSTVAEVSESYLYQSARESLDQTIKASRKFLDGDDYSVEPVSKKFRYDYFDCDISLEFPKILHRLETAEKKLLQLRKEEDFREIVESVKVKTLEDNCDKLKKELQEAIDKLQQPRESSRQNSNVEDLLAENHELKQTVLKLTFERDELAKRVEIIPELEETVENLSKEKENLIEKIEMYEGKSNEEGADLNGKICENRSDLAKRREELKAINEKKLKHLQSHQEKIIKKLNDHWQKKCQKVKESQEFRFNQMKDEFRKLRSSIEASLNIVTNIENGSSA